MMWGGGGEKSEMPSLRLLGARSGAAVEPKAEVEHYIDPEETVDDDVDILEGGTAVVDGEAHAQRDEDHVVQQQGDDDHHPVGEPPALGVDHPVVLEVLPERVGRILELQDKRGMVELGGRCTLQA